jgi:hypothetical protein
MRNATMTMTGDGVRGESCACGEMLPDRAAEKQMNGVSGWRVRVRREGGEPRVAWSCPCCTEKARAHKASLMPRVSETRLRVFDASSGAAIGVR